MSQDIHLEYQKHIVRGRRRSALKKAVSVMACAVIFCTTYALILPAITMEQETFCGIEEHIHSEECINRNSRQTLICTGENLQIHTHSNGCFDAEGNLTCGKADYVVHTHEAHCYDASGILVCTLPERAAHVHTDSCYVPGETQPEVLHVHDESCSVPERGRLICTKEEYEGHAHGDACYEVSDVLLCTKQENHIHNDSCYTRPLICSISTEPHIHGADCRGRGGLICTTPENHVHGDGCRETTCICENTDENHSHGSECYSSRTICTIPENHSHGDSCYEPITVCGKTEGECHVHDDGCYGSPELTCGEEENHIHGDACYESRLTCTTAEDPGHTHGDSCYSWETVIGCGLEEGQPEPTEPAEPVLACTEPVAAVHVHTEACFETVTAEPVLICTETDADHIHTPECYELLCGMEAHSHGLACFSDPEADLETAEDWEATFAHVELTGNWNEDVIAIAETQLGYAESSRNYAVWADETTHGYTRYGQWYGSPYGDWCAMFVSFCLHYAEVEGMPLHWGVRPWIEELTDLKLYHEAEVYEPKPGDVIFYDWEGDDLSDHVGFVAEIIPATEDEPAQVKALEGNSSNCVQYVYYDIDDSRILGYSELPDNPEIYSCGLLRHSHNEYCYDDAGNFICQQIEHTHTEVCEPRDILYCGLEEHAHTETCFDENGEQICILTEHTHTESCTVEAPAEETPVYHCGLEAHTHTETCFDENGELLCEIPEHIHTEECTAAPAAPTYYCGLEEHTHVEACCNEAGELVCEIPEHTHTEECTVQPVTYYCGLEEHTHSETCYNEAGELVCEIPEHTHTEECTVQPVTYYCFMQEHTHTEVCYDASGNLLCQVPEHVHTDECTKIPVYLCGLQEHTHGEECYDDGGSLICQLQEHTHSEQCVIVGGYICGMIEHAHNENCYDAEGNFICTLEEHTHTDACKAHNAYACGLTEHTHGEACYDAEGNLICQIPEHIHTAACIGRNLYYSDMQIRVHAVIRGVEDLPRKLTLTVTPVTQEQYPEAYGAMQVAVSKEIADRDRFVGSATFYDMQLLSDGVAYELPETAQITVTMEFTSPVFTSEDMKESLGIHAMMLASEDGSHVTPILPVPEEIPTVPEETADSSVLDTVINTISDAFSNLVPAADATELDPNPENSVEGDPVENNPHFQINAVSGETYENQSGGITSITFQTNNLATFTLAQTQGNYNGKFWMRVEDTEGGLTDDGVYMIVSAEANLALCSGSTNYRRVTVEAIKNNEQYYNITDDDTNNADTINDNTLHWKIVKNANNNNYQIQNVNTSQYLAVGSGVSLGNNGANLTLTHVTDAYNTNVATAWRIRNASNANQYLFYNYEKDLGFYVNSLGGNPYVDSYTTPILNGWYDYRINIANDSQSNFIIFKQVNASFTVPSDVTKSANELETESGTIIEKPAAKPDADQITGGITAVDTAVEQEINGAAISVSGKAYSDPATSSIENNFKVTPGDGDYVTKDGERILVGSDEYFAKHSVNDGKVMTDKSVIYGEDDYGAFTEFHEESFPANTFSVTLSALGQAYRMPATEKATIPVDVVFVLDTSGSMYEHDSSTDAHDDKRLSRLITAANKSIDYILYGGEPCFNASGVLTCNNTSADHEHLTQEEITKRHENNRVGIALFSSGAGELLPLGRYSPNSNNQYIFDYNNTHVLYTAQRLKDSDGNEINQHTVTGLTDGGTFTQAGIQAGYNIFAKADPTVELTLANGSKKNVVRQPVFILLSDGEPTHCTNIYNDPMNGPYYGNSEMDHHNAKGIMGYYTVLSANYFKRMVGIHYGTPALFHTIGMGIQATSTAPYDDETDENDIYKRAVLDPTAERLVESGCKWPDDTINIMRNLLNEGYDDDYVAVYADVVNYGNYFDAGDLYLDSNSHVPVLHDHPYYKGGVSYYDYADGAHFGDYTAAELENVFNEILTMSLKDKEFGFILYQSSNDVYMTDPIRQGMEIEGPPILRYDGKNYEHTGIVTVDEQTVKYVYEYTYTNPNTYETAELEDIQVTIKTETDGAQTVELYVPDSVLPVFTPEETNDQFYFETNPVRLIYQVGLTNESEAAVLKLQETGGKLTFYTNDFNDLSVGGATVISPLAETKLYPSTDNPFYFDLDPNDEVPRGYHAHHDVKDPDRGGNVTDTAGFSTNCTDDNDAPQGTYRVIHSLGNNGKLVFEVEKEIVELPVEKVWDNRVTNVDSKEISVALYKVTETTSETGTVQTVEPVETVKLNSTKEWKHTFVDLDAPNEEFFYAIVETDSDGFLPTYSGGEIIEITVDNGSPVKAVKVDSAFFNTETEEDAEIPVITITNVPGVELPKTGGPGTILYTTGGLLLIAAAIFLLFYNRKSQISRP